ncbi:hypothetical protein VTN77DRAFT_5223 [Rasamsonia byssochlamydoides]|uniref:uncharacterized protein n=1 Tax=Rasamsonia byssochlamydoides TaxID=89139 RepID=UPI0037425EAF
MDLNQLISELREDLNGFREEIRRMDHAHTELIKKESAHLHARMNSLSAEVAHVHRELAYRITPTRPLPPEFLPQKKESQSELKTMRSSEMPAASSNTESETTPTPRVSFRTPSEEHESEHSEDGIVSRGDSRDRMNVGWARHLETTGSPPPKGRKETKDGDLHPRPAQMMMNTTTSSAAEENKKKGKNEAIKSTPHRRGYFSFGKHHRNANNSKAPPKTPIRGGDDSKRGRVEETSSCHVPDVPPLQYPPQDVAEGSGDRSPSPTMVHPALRTTYQRQIMRERELLRQQMQEQQAAPPLLARSTERPKTPTTADAREFSGASWYDEAHSEDNWI